MGAGAEGGAAAIEAAVYKLHLLVALKVQRWIQGHLIGAE
jgi:hypothetical protein